MTVTVPLWAAIIVPLSTATFGFLVCAWMTMAGDGEDDQQKRQRHALREMTRLDEELGLYDDEKVGGA